MGMTVDKSFGDLGPGGNQDPVVPDWRSMEIPDAWPDLSNFSSLGGFWSLLKLIAAKKRPTVELPEGMPGREMIPKYVLREFHNFPNGNYSKAMTRRYINNFDRFMLGEIKKLRKRLAAEFNGASRVLDIGCSGGGVAAELEALGVEDVWGIDPSPYLLKHGADEYPNIKFVQGIIEETGFPDRRFEGATAGFLFHEMPIKYFELSLKEINRILEPGSLLAIGEPSPVQAYSGYWEMIRRFGLKGLYFSWFAKSIHEPFLNTWHNCDLQGLFDKHGFDLELDEVGMPIRYILARKR
ncbi:MAG: class I SAM-dependent methyltransferase [Candidatus Thiodiazotropha lotti]|nr:class I SAM-dependent methyltransferase [Candidatus Thiodiazotropha lotti]